VLSWRPGHWFTVFDAVAQRLWLNDAVDARVEAADPMRTVERIARMMFEG
jgi:hypothetical protein